MKGLLSFALGMLWSNQ